MDVMADNIWATTKMLHMRVTVWGGDRKWRRKFDVAVPLDDIPVEALEPLLRRFWESHSGRDPEQLPLF